MSNKKLLKVIRNIIRQLDAEKQSFEEVASQRLLRRGCFGRFVCTRLFVGSCFEEVASERLLRRGCLEEVASKKLFRGACFEEFA